MNGWQQHIISSFSDDVAELDTNNNYPPSVAPSSLPTTPEGACGSQVSVDDQEPSLK